MTHCENVQAQEREQMRERFRQTPDQVLAELQRRRSV
jgi:hypothetical protein